MSLSALLLEELVAWLEAVLGSLPGRVGVVTRRQWWQRRLSALGRGAIFETATVIGMPQRIAIGDRFALMSHSMLFAGNGRIQIGDRVSINMNVQINSSDGGEIVIGSDVLIGPNVVLRASNHVFTEAARPVNQQGHSGGRIVLQDDVWIGANAFVAAGVTVGAHAVVAAGAVVTHDVANGVIVAGVPARPIGRRGAPTE